MLARSVEKSKQKCSFEPSLGNVFEYLGLKAQTLYFSNPVVHFQEQMSYFCNDIQLWQQETSFSDKDILVVGTSCLLNMSKQFTSGKTIIILDTSNSRLVKILESIRLRLALKRENSASYIILASLHTPSRVLDNDKAVIYDYFRQLTPLNIHAQSTLTRLKNIVKTLLLQPNCWVVRP